MSEEKLKPCSCGGEAKVIKDVLGFWAVECKDCLTRLGVSDTKEEIIEAWNDMRRKEMSEEILRTCPFCGKEPVYVADGKVICVCGAMIKSFNDWKPFTNQEAVDRWNKRYKEQDDEK